METFSPRPCSAARSLSFSVSGTAALSLLHSSREKRRNGDRSMVSIPPVTTLAEPANRTHLVSPGVVGNKQVVADELFQGARYLPVGMVLERVAEVTAVDLPVPQERTEAGIEHAS